MMSRTTRRVLRSAAFERALGFGALIGIGVLLYSTINWQFLSYLDFGIVYTYRMPLLQGLGITLLLTGISMVVGYITGVLMAIAYQIPPFRILWLPWRIAPWRWVITVHVELWRNTPLLVQLFWVHFALPVVTGIPTTVFVSGVIALSLQASAYLTEIARGGINAVPKGQWEAAYSLGLPGPTRWLTIVLPQAMKIMIPPLANTAISFFKATTVLSLLAVGELMTISNTIANFTFKQIEVLTAVGVIFLLLGSVFSSATYKLEKLLKRSER
jgi:polar amino acid transport system permease protein